MKSKPSLPSRKAIITRERTRVQGAVDAATAALGDGLTTIAGVHAAIADKPFAALRLAPGVAGVSESVRVVHDGVTNLVYGSIRAGLGLAGAAARIAASLAPPRPEAPLGSMADLARAALNGFAGDHLARSENPLAISMDLRLEGNRVPIERDALAAAFPKATRRLAVFTHGLACNESMWDIHSERHYGAPGINYGTRLAADLGYTPLYVRYNTGLHIAENGRSLALLLQRIVGEWPAGVDELALIGHSMGGLVVRSACHYGRESDLDWTRSVRQVVFLGSPHLGAPLEKAANVAAWCLGLSDITRPFATTINRRSTGIKDLRFGTLRDDDWTEHVDAFLSGRTSDVAVLEDASHYFVAATVTRDPSHPFGLVVGDLLVREASAYGGRRTRHAQFALGTGKHFGPMHHLELLNHPDLYEEMRQWLGGGQTRAPNATAS